MKPLNIFSSGMSMFRGMKAFKGSAMPTASNSIGDIYLSPDLSDQGLFKAYMPLFLYNPPFGYPRPENLGLIRQLAKNAYIFSVTKTIKEEVANTEWDVVFREDSEKKDDPKIELLRKNIKKFFNNPNQNKESFADLRRMACDDILELDSGIWVKVFNKRLEFSQMFARDGSSFLKNPDVFGYMGDRIEYIDFSPFLLRYGKTTINSPELKKQFGANFSDQAAYFQYGTAVSAAIPVPFGRREIIYMMQNPQSSTPYGRSPISLLADIINTLVYGSNYNSDFYMNSNWPEGIISILGANSTELETFKERLNAETRVKDENTGYVRKVFFRTPIVGNQVTFTPFQLDPKTMQIIEQQTWFYKLVLAVFGVPADAMGFTEDSNRATGQNQLRLFLRKAARPILQVMKYNIDMSIIPEWGSDAFEHLEWKWIQYDLDEDIRRHELFEKQINIGIKTPKMIAEDEGIDYSEVEKFKEEKMKKDIELAKATAPQLNQSFGNNDKKEDNTKKLDNSNLDDNKPKETLKATNEDKLSASISKEFTEKSNKIMIALDAIENELNSRT